jgi:hypothetical protein
MFHYPPQGELDVTPGITLVKSPFQPFLDTYNNLRPQHILPSPQPLRHRNIPTTIILQQLIRRPVPFFNTIINPTSLRNLYKLELRRVDCATRAVAWRNVIDNRPFVALRPWTRIPPAQANGFAREDGRAEVGGRGGVVADYVVGV